MDDSGKRLLLIGYARVSTADQKLNLQLDALRKAGVEDDHIHTDIMSGSAHTRPGLIDAFKDLRQGACLVVWKLDRLGRSVIGVLNTIEQIKNKGAELKSLTEAIDTRTAMGKFLVNILASMAQMERDLIIERTVEGQKAARARGQKLGRASSMTPEKIAELDRMLSEGGISKNDMAKKLGISRATFYNFMAARRDLSNTAQDLDSEESN